MLLKNLLNLVFCSFIPFFFFAFVYISWAFCMISFHLFYWIVNCISLFRLPQWLLKKSQHTFLTYSVLLNFLTCLRYSVESFQQYPSIYSSSWPLCYCCQKFTLTCVTDITIPNYYYSFKTEPDGGKCSYCNVYMACYVPEKFMWQCRNVQRWNE